MPEFYIDIYQKVNECFMTFARKIFLSEIWEEGARAPLPPPRIYAYTMCKFVISRPIIIYCNYCL